ncbi:hypothetical protein BOTBODRAFT_47098 [Botryobasidium botryosum FD-172 SS1]|uniref:Uncharacterized protein n=1 Tax=Botryobasidium botryosum (strain FD-172 SS1) TaxID=930990 RepID=A0A067M3T1_BOTB1|nr:hypothetical protein BOTBODRAFT_47098 [Botryobasidium botryosum FD-172 SS1]
MNTDFASRVASAFLTSVFILLGFLLRSNGVMNSRISTTGVVALVSSILNPSFVSAAAIPRQQLASLFTSRTVPSTLLTNLMKLLMIAPISGMRGLSTSSGLYACPDTKLGDLSTLGTRPKTCTGGKSNQEFAMVAQLEMQEECQADGPMLRHVGQPVFHVSDLRARVAEALWVKVLTISFRSPSDSDRNVRFARKLELKERLVNFGSIFCDKD